MRTPHRFPSSVSTAIAGILLVPTIALAQDPLKLNVPYRCTDGVTRTVTRCATNDRGGEVCFWREEKDGQSNERFNVRSQMDGWLKTCTATAVPTPPPAPAAAPAARPAAATPQAAPGGPLNPAYLAGFPSVDKVKSDVRGANAVDTVARQVATFDALEKLLQKTRGPGGFLPDESRFFREYYAAQQDVALKGTEKFSGAEMATYRQSLAKYSDDAAFATSAQSLLSPSARAEIGQKTGTTTAQASGASPQTAQAGNPQFVRNDPGTVAARRCLESGGSELECVAKGLSTGFDDFTGLSSFTKMMQAKGLVRGGSF
jgi:hypothetical protein